MEVAYAFSGGSTVDYKLHLDTQKKIERCLSCKELVWLVDGKYTHVQQNSTTPCIFTANTPLHSEKGVVNVKVYTHKKTVIHICIGTQLTQQEYNSHLHAVPSHYNPVFVFDISAWTAYVYKERFFLRDVSTVDYGTEATVYYRHGKDKLVRVLGSSLRMRACGTLRYVRKMATIPAFRGLMTERVYANTWAGIPRRTFTPQNIAASYVLDTIHRQHLCSQLTFDGITWVDAPAGGGKTTLLLDVVHHYPKKRFLFLTFSKALQLEMEAKRNRLQIENMACYTIDAYIRERLMTAASTTTEDEDDEGKVDFSIEDIYSYLTDTQGPVQEDEFGPVSYMSDFFLNRQILKKHYNRPAGVAQVVECIVADRMLKICKTHKDCKIESRILPQLVKLKPYYTFTGARHRVLTENKQLIGRDLYDMVVVDEYQDMDDNMRTFLQQQNIPILFVGDSNQEIYQFRTRLDRCKCVTKTLDDDMAVKKNRPGTTITLYRSFRTPMSIMYFLMSLSKNRYLGCGRDYTRRTGVSAVHIIAENSVPLIMGGNVKGKEAFQNHIALLVRTKAELLKWYLVLIKRGVINIRVQDADRFLKDIQDARAENKDTSFVTIARAIPDSKYELLCDRLNTMSLNPAHPIIATVHGYKGLESDYVITSARFKNIFNEENDTENNRVNKEEERNIAYVAMTRAKKCLFLYQ